MIKLHGEGFFRTALMTTLSALALSCAARSEARAQQAPAEAGAPEQITVVARKRAENAQSVPVSLVTLSARTIQEDDVRTLADIAHLTPGLIYDQGINANDTRPAIRGITDQRGRPGVAILEDGIDISGQSILFAGGSSAIKLDLMDLDQIEVVKGPQSVFYGRNAFSGAIDYITKKPSATWEGYADAGIAQGGLYEERAGISGPITDTLRLRANIESKDFAGFYTNQVDGKGLGGATSRGAALALDYVPNDVLDILVRGEFTRDTNKQAASVLDGANNSFTLNGQNVFIGTLTANPKDVKFAPGLPGLTDNNARVSADISYNLGWAALKSQTALIADTERDDEEADFSLEPAGTFGFGSRQFAIFKQQALQVSQDLRLVSPTDNSRFHWMAGIYYYYENANALDDGIVAQDSCSTFSFFKDVINFNALCSAPNGSVIGTNKIAPVAMNRNTEHYSVYGSVTYQVAPKFNVTAEARYAIERINASQPGFSHEIAEDYYQSEDGGPLLTYTPSGYLAAIPPLTSATVTSYDLDPRFSADYHLTNDVMFYASAAKGTKPAGVNQVIGTTDRYDLEHYKEEKLWSYEAGIKSAFAGGSVVIDADLFYMDYKNQLQLLSEIVPGVPFPVSGVQNVGQSTSEGAELGASWKPVRPVTMSLAYTYDRARVVNFDDNATAALALYPPNGSLHNKRIPGVPTDTLSFTARYDGSIADKYHWYVDGVTTYESDRYANGDPYNFIRLAPFVQQDFHLGATRGRYTVEAYVNNAFDDLTVRNGIAYFNVAGNFQNGAVAYLTNPRQFGGRIRIKF